MNYLKIYDNLMIRAKGRILEGYKEKHHIIPRCMNGTDAEDNLVFLTAEEHYLAHQLLVKIYPENKKLIYAAKCMTVSSKNQNRITNKLYGWIKKQWILTHSERMKGENHPYFGKVGPAAGRKHTEEEKNKISKAAKGRKLKPLTDEHKRKISNSNIGKHSQPKSIEHRKKISEAQKGIPWSDKRREANPMSYLKRIELELASIDYDESQ